MSKTIDITRRWPDKEGMKDSTVMELAVSAFECIAFAKPTEGTFGFSPVSFIVRGVPAFTTFMTDDEVASLREAVSSRNLLNIAPDRVRPGNLRFFDEPVGVLLDPTRITRIVDGPKEINDSLIFDVVFTETNALPFTASIRPFDSEEALRRNPVRIAPDETERQKFFREADEGTVISDAYARRRQMQRRILNKFVDELAQHAPQLYRIENTKYAFFARPEDIEDVFVYTQQTDSARITFNKAAGEQYGMPIMQSVHFKSPEAAVDGAEKLRNKMARPKP